MIKKAQFNTVIVLCFQAEGIKPVNIYKKFHLFNRQKIFRILFFLINTYSYFENYDFNQI